MNNAEQPHRRTRPRLLALASAAVVLVALLVFWLWPKVPVDVAIRQSPWIGQVLQISNESDEKLIGLTVRFHNRRKGQDLECHLGLLEPREQKEAGWLEGWVMEKGETVTIEARGFRSRAYTTEELGINLALEE